MSHAIATQASLFVPDPALEREGFAPGTPVLSLALDYRDWLQLLADEWLGPRPGGYPLGVAGNVVHRSADQDRLVIGWLRDGALPDAPVAILGAHGWRSGTLSDVGAGDLQVEWRTVLPLDAFGSFSVADARLRERVMLLAGRYSTLAKFSQQLRVQTCDIAPAAPYSHVALAPMAQPPRHWDALRGAAAMAFWSVPTVGPWMQLLCDTFAPSQDGAAAAALGLPWWREPPWRCAAQDGAAGTPQAALWRAASAVFSEAQLDKGWQSQAVLHELLDRAVSFGAEPAALTHFATRTLAMLTDRLAISADAAQDDPLGLALQLVLLRPDPAHFLGWLDQLPAMPPGVWWTGATLSGLACGFRQLDTRFTGTPAARQFIASRTWALATDDTGLFPVQRDSRSHGALVWTIEHGAARLRAGGALLAERAESARGKWFAAALAEPENRAAAIALARLHCPAALTVRLEIEDTSLAWQGVDGGLLKKNGAALEASGIVALTLPRAYRMFDDLDDDVFRDWVLRGAIAERLAPPPSAEQASRTRPVPALWLVHEVAGLSKRLDFVSEEEERELIGQVDASPWETSLARRVQHYGWRYDYKRGSIDRAARLGPLPDWAARLARRMVAQGLLAELPDQVIVNEYLGEQGIAAHIDCPTCFRGAIVTISLLETWEMVFKRDAQRKHVEILERRSACIIDGEARALWKHEIPKKKKGPDGVRHRRISLTFRKVDLPG